LRGVSDLFPLIHTPDFVVELNPLLNQASFVPIKGAEQFVGFLDVSTFFFVLLNDCL
jgi:hypothetical protein